MKHYENIGWKRTSQPHLTVSWKGNQISNPKNASHTEKKISFHVEWNMIVLIIFIWNHKEFRLVIKKRKIVQSYSIELDIKIYFFFVFIMYI